MINWEEELKRVPELTPEEQEMRKLEAEYEKMFGEKFGYCIVCSPPLEVALSEIKECLRTKTKQKKKESIPGAIY